MRKTAGPGLHQMHCFRWFLYRWHAVINGGQRLWYSGRLLRPVKEAEYMKSYQNYENSHKPHMVPRVRYITL